MSRQDREAALRFSERRRREDEAPRLAELFPDLVELCIHLRESRGVSAVAGSTYMRRIVIEHAPALFHIPCADPSCRDGGHDITRELLSGLRRSSVTIEGEDACGGYAGASPCRRVLHFTATPVYRAPSQRP
jgi:hypothetical protein